MHGGGGSPVLDPLGSGPVDPVVDALTCPVDPGVPVDPAVSPVVVVVDVDVLVVDVSPIVSLALPEPSLVLPLALALVVGAVVDVVGSPVGVDVVDEADAEAEVLPSSPHAARAPLATRPKRQVESCTMRIPTTLAGFPGAI